MTGGVTARALLPGERLDHRGLPRAGAPLPEALDRLEPVVTTLRREGRPAMGREIAAVAPVDLEVAFACREYPVKPMPR